MNLETWHQIELFNHIYKAEKFIPNFKTCICTLNGVHLKGGARAGALIKRMGGRSGVFDVVWFHAKGGYHGAHLELKAPETDEKPAGRVSPEQKKWKENVEAEGYLAHVAWGWEAAWEFLMKYYEGGYERR